MTLPEAIFGSVTIVAAMAFLAWFAWLIHKSDEKG